MNYVTIAVGIITSALFFYIKSAKTIRAKDNGLILLNQSI